MPIETLARTMKKLAAFLSLLLPPILLLSQRQNSPQPTSLVFTHITVIDATGAPAQPDMTVVITGDRITTLGKAGKVHLPANAQWAPPASS